MRVLCTGGCGFLGSNLTGEALARGYEVWVLDNLSRLGSDLNLRYLREQGLVNFIEADTRDSAAVRDAVAQSRPDIVFHVAGQVAMTTSLASPMDDAFINIVGTLNVLEAVRASAPDAAVIYSSTNKVYGDLEWVALEESGERYVNPDHPKGFGEATPLDFRSPYGCSKGSADQYVLDYARQFGVNTAVFRHSSMYGDRQFATADQGWVGWFVKKVLEIADTPERKGRVLVSGDGKQVRDMLHADDMVDLYYRGAEAARTAPGEAFNIGGGMANSLSVRQLLDFLSREIGCSVEIETSAWRNSDQRVFVADLTKAETRLGWTPRVSYEVGLRRMIDWVRSSH